MLNWKSYHLKLSSNVIILLMKIIEEMLIWEEIRKLKDKFENYIKLTVDIKKEIIIAGCVLHADEEKILL